MKKMKIDLLGRDNVPVSNNVVLCSLNQSINTVSIPQPCPFLTPRELQPLGFTLAIHNMFGVCVSSVLQLKAVCCLRWWL